MGGRVQYLQERVQSSISSSQYEREVIQLLKKVRPTRNLSQVEYSMLASDKIRSHAEPASTSVRRSKSH